MGSTLGKGLRGLPEQVNSMVGFLTLDLHTQLARLFPRMGKAGGELGEAGDVGLACIWALELDFYLLPVQQVTGGPNLALTWSAADQISAVSD